MPQALLLLAWAIIWFGVARALPDANQLLNYEPPLPTNVRGINGAPIHSYARERRVEIAFDDFPKPVLAAFLSAEDKNFFKHGGVDYFGVVRAVVQQCDVERAQRRARRRSRSRSRRTC